MTFHLLLHSSFLVQETCVDALLGGDRSLGLTGPRHAISALGHEGTRPTSGCALVDARSADHRPAARLSRLVQIGDPEPIAAVVDQGAVTDVDRRLAGVVQDCHAIAPLTGGLARHRAGGADDVGVTAETDPDF